MYISVMWLANNEYDDDDDDDDVNKHVEGRGGGVRC